MMMRSLRTIMISAYLSVMLTSSVVHVRGNVLLAGTIDPTAAQRALQSAVAGLNAQGWATSATIPTTVAFPSALMSPLPASQAVDPIISEELMARLIKRTLASNKEAWITAGVGALFEISNSTDRMPAKQISATKPDGKHYIGLPLKEGSEDIIVTFTNETTMEFYLTDKSGNLRAAAISGDRGIGLRLIPNEQAAEKFKAEMRLLAKLAEMLPPTGTAIAGNS